MGASTFRVQVDILGDTVGAFRQFVRVPETWSRSDWISAFDAYAETKNWPKHWRAPPDDDDCKAPADLIERWRNGWRKAG